MRSYTVLKRRLARLARGIRTSQSSRSLDPRAMRQNARPMRFRPETEKMITQKLLYIRQAHVLALPHVFRELARIELDFNYDLSQPFPNDFTHWNFDEEAVARLIEDSRRLQNLAIRAPGNLQGKTQVASNATNDLPRVTFLYSPIPPYDTTRLDLKSRQIRLLSLLPGSLGEPIRCNLFVATSMLDFRFNALSYVWGTTVNPGTIDVNGTPLKVSQNLHTALECLRHAEKAITLWVDAICIDQSNNLEKNVQVQKMGEIYRSAQNVYVFLGPKDKNSDRLLNFFEYEHIQIPELGVDSRDPASRLRTEVYLEKNQVGLIRAFLDVILRPWFSRMWIFQEYHLAQREPRFYLGNRFLTAPTFLGTHFELLLGICLGTLLGVPEVTLAPRFSGMSTFDIRRKALMVHTAVSKDAIIPQTPAMWLSNPSISASGCANPRDKLFGTLAMFDPVARAILQPDYNLPVPEVFLQGTVWCNMMDNHLGSYLRYHLLQDDNYPSWTLDFARPIQLDSVETLLMADEKIFPDKDDAFSPFCVIHQRLLYIRGIKFATITEVFDLNTSFDEVSALRDLWHLEKKFADLPWSSNAASHTQVDAARPSIRSWYTGMVLDMGSSLVPDSLFYEMALGEKFPDFVGSPTYTKNHGMQDLLGALLFDVEALLTEFSEACETIKLSPENESRAIAGIPGRYRQLRLALLSSDREANELVIEKLSDSLKEIIPNVFDPEASAEFVRKWEEDIASGVSQQPADLPDPTEPPEDLAKSPWSQERVVYAYKNLQASLMPRLRKSCFFVTDNHVPGVGPEDVRGFEPGDEIVFLREMPAPVAIRACEDEPDTYRFVGIVNLRGLKDGVLYDLIEKKGEKMKVFKIR